MQIDDDLTYDSDTSDFNNKQPKERKIQVYLVNDIQEVSQSYCDTIKYQNHHLRLTKLQKIKA